MSRRARRSAASLGSPAGLVLALAIGGCSEPAAAPTVTFDTLPSGVVHVSNGAVPAWPQDGGWRAVEELRIGAVDGPIEETFGDVRGVELDALGRVYVVDRQAKTVRVFGPDGAHVRDVGGAGEGPGEFTNPNGLAFDPAGRLWVADENLWRISAFDTAGTPLTDLRKAVRSYGYVWEGGFDESGRIHEIALWMPEGAEQPAQGQVRRDPERPDAPPDTLPLPALRRSIHRVEIGGGPAAGGATLHLQVPFSPTSLWARAPNGDVWAGVSDAYRLVRLTPEGDTLRIVERTWEPDPLPEGALDAALADLRERSAEGAREVAALAPDHLPAFERLVVDDRDHLWVLRPEATPGRERDRTTWDVFDPEGRWLGPVVLPFSDAPPPRIRGDRAAGVARDELGVERAVVVRLEGREDGGAAER